MKHLFDYFLIGIIVILIGLIGFGLIKGYLIINLDDDVEDSDRYWENNDISLFSYVYDVSEETLAINLRNEKDYPIQILSFNIGEYVDYTHVNLYSAETYVYVVPSNCVYEEKFEFPISIRYIDLEAGEEHIFNGEYLFKGYCS